MAPVVPVHQVAKPESWVSASFSPSLPKTEQPQALWLHLLWFSSQSSPLPPSHYPHSCNLPTHHLKPSNGLRAGLLNSLLGLPSSPSSKQAEWWGCKSDRLPPHHCKTLPEFLSALRTKNKQLLWFSCLQDQLWPLYGQGWPLSLFLYPQPGAFPQANPSIIIFVYTAHLL